MAEGDFVQFSWHVRYRVTPDWLNTVNVDIHATIPEGSTRAHAWFGFGIDCASRAVTRAIQVLVETQD